jgi:hypothetical protein
MAASCRFPTRQAASRQPALVSGALKSHFKLEPPCSSSRIHMPHEFARLLLLERNRIFASIATIMTVVVPVAEARADDVAVGDQLTLSELTRPDRFAWPAVFICRHHPGDTQAVVVPANDPDEMNERLLAAGIWPEDCHGGFSIRSIRTDPSKLNEIEGAPSDTAPRPGKAGATGDLPPSSRPQ